MTEIKEFINRYSSLLALNKSISFTEAEKRASEFLSALATITEWRHLLSEDKIRLTSVQTAVYAEQMSNGTSTTMTANKIAAEASKQYTEAREELERLENDLSYLKAYYDIFFNAHLFYRQMCKEGRE